MLWGSIGAVVLAPTGCRTKTHVSTRLHKRSAFYRRSTTIGNYLLALGIRHEDLLLTAAQFEQVKKYLISDEDAQKYLAIKPSEIIRKYGKQGFLPGIDEDNPGYQERCALFNLLKNGYTLYVEDESGFLTYRKYGAGTDPF